MAGTENRVSKETLEMEFFERYVNEDHKAYLKRPYALRMLEGEFSLPAEQAIQIFEVFDRDKKGMISIREFQQFHHCVGANANGWVEKFKELDADGSGKLDMNEARKGLAEMRTGGGKTLGDKELEFFLKTTADDNGKIDMGAFVGQLRRLRVYKAPK